MAFTMTIWFLIIQVTNKEKNKIKILSKNKTIYAACATFMLLFLFFQESPSSNDLFISTKNQKNTKIKFVKMKTLSRLKGVNAHLKTTKIS